MFCALVAGLALGWAVSTRPLTALVYAVPFGLLSVQQAKLHHALVIVRGQSVKDYEAVSWANSPTRDSDVVFAPETDMGISHLIEQYPG
jgi:hypothetical protein